MKRISVISRTGRKLKAQGGFTMVELLVTVILITIVGGVITATVNIATQSLKNGSQESDAQLLCSALSVFMQDELTYAGKVNATSGKTVEFTDNARGLGKKCSFRTNGDGHLVMTYYKSGTIEEYDPVGAGDYGGKTAHKSFRAVQEVTIEGKLLKVYVAVIDANSGIEIAENTFYVKPVAPGSNVK
ncbi:MAG: type II secretion system protein [Oscillospiraceae bacterium]|nr:type II secretion system protein [Oscillospiraceae bacterium]